jgi:hypothetical protein
MTTIQAHFPLSIRLLNSAFPALGKFGNRLLSLEPDALMAKASKQTGLRDFGSDYFHKPLQLLCDSLEEDAYLTGLGRIMARQEVLRLLENRLQFIDIFKQNPEIANETIIEPIFILGMPRTGTTSLHELMAMDPQFRVPLTWEVARPFPPPERDSYLTDPRIAMAAKDLANVDKILPNFKDMHPMGAQLPQECVSLFSHDFASMIFDVQFRLKQYQAWLIQEDMTEVFVNHRRWLQLLQWKCPGNTWVLKSPQYLWNVEDMLREYPDARVIQTHRDPVKVAVSIGNLTTTLRSLASDHLNLRETTRDYADLLKYGTDKTMAARRKGLLSPDRIIDIQFSEFRKGPIEALGSAYNFFGLEMNETIAKNMSGFLSSSHETERHGKHLYSLEASGIDLVQERARFAEYQQSYDVPSEPFG